MNKTADDKQMVKISIGDGIGILVDREKFYNNENRIVLDFDGEKNNYRFLSCENDCWLLVPEKLVPKPIKKIKGTVVSRKKKEK